MRKYLWAVVIFLPCIGLSCLQECSEFYSKQSGFDFKRIPLIQPYELKLLTGTTVWTMNVREWSLNDGGNLVRVDGVIVRDSLIFTHCSQVAQPEVGKESELWMFLVPNLKIEIRAGSRDALCDTLTSLGWPVIIDCPTEQDLHPCETLWRDFQNDGRVPWSPCPR